MNWFEDLGGALGIRRKKTLAGKVQDAAENVVETVQDLYETAVENVAPVLAKSGQLAYKASDAGAAAETTVAAAGAVAGFFAAVLSVLWWLIKFAVKTAILVGVAYAGWQWLQSRNNSGGYGSSGEYNSYNSTYGSMSTPSNP